jgi:hypothetical protein
MRFLAACLSLLLLAGCLAKEVTIDTPFDPAAAAFIRTEGKAIVEGHAFLKRWDGRAANAVGEFAWMIPVTPYSEERFRKLYGEEKLMPAAFQNRVANSDPRFMDFVRRTKTESDGSFRFEKVGPGEYFLVSSVVYKEKQDDVLPVGGSIYERVTVRGDEKKIIRVVLTDK